MGSNIGDKWQYLRDAVTSLTGVVAISNVYETDPVGGPPGQEKYLNLVLAIETDLTPRALLAVCHRLESGAHRIRRDRNGPRTLDVDILLMGDLRVQEDDLVIPHPRMWDRWFVMAPLSELAPDLVTAHRPAHMDASVRSVGPLWPPSR